MDVRELVRHAERVGLWPFKREKDSAPAEEAADGPVGTRGWWFARGPAERGTVEYYSGDPVPGRAGLHAAPSPLAALPHARSAYLCQVELDGTVAVVEGQMAATRRRVVFCVDAQEALYRLVVRWIERVIGSSLETRVAHAEAADRARERALEADDRLRDARWVLEEGSRWRDRDTRAQAEGALAGADRAAAEARATAESHEAAASLLTGEEIWHLAHAVEHVTKAYAAFESGGADEALAKAIAKLDAEALEELSKLAPKEALPPLPALVTQAQATRAAPDADALPDAIEIERDGEPLGDTPEPPVAEPRWRPDLPEPAMEVAPGLQGLFSWPTSPVSRVLDTIAPLSRVLDAPSPARKAPVPSGEEVIARLRELLEADAGFVACHSLAEDFGWGFRQTPSCVLLVRRARAEGSWELVDALDADPILRQARMGFVVAWTGSSSFCQGVIWYVCGRLLHEPEVDSLDGSHIPDDLARATEGAPLDLSSLDPLILELALSRRVESATWLSDREHVLAIESQDEGLRAVLARLSRAGVTQVVARVQRGAGEDLYVTPGVADEDVDASELSAEVWFAARQSFYVRRSGLAPALDRPEPLDAAEPLEAPGAWHPHPPYDASIEATRASDPLRWLAECLVGGPPYESVHWLGARRTKMPIDGRHVGLVLAVSPDAVDAVAVHLRTRAETTRAIARA